MSEELNEVPFPFIQAHVEGDEIGVTIDWPSGVDLRPFAALLINLQTGGLSDAISEILAEMAEDPEKAEDTVKLALSIRDSLGAFVEDVDGPLIPAAATFRYHSGKGEVGG